MLQSLADVALATKMLKSVDLDINPIDANYNKLKCDMTPLDKSDKERVRCFHACHEGCKAVLILTHSLFAHLLCSHCRR